MRLLTDFFIEKYKKELNKENLKISQEAMKLLMKLPWEGNIRELENTIERAAILCSNDSIEAEDVQPDTLYGDDKSAIDSDIDIQQLIPKTLRSTMYCTLLKKDVDTGFGG